MAKEYTKDDYQKVLDMYNDYQAKKDTFTPEKQAQIENAFWSVVDKMYGSQWNDNPIVDWYAETDWSAYQVRKDWTVEQVRKSNNDIAQEVLAWKWWNGERRRSSLEKAWYDYNKIQSIINWWKKGSKKVESEKPTIQKPVIESKVYPVWTHVKTETYPVWTMMSDGSVVPASFDASAYPVGSAVWWWTMMSNWTVAKWAYPVGNAAWQRVVEDWTLMSDWSVVPASFDPNMFKISL